MAAGTLKLASMRSYLYPLLRMGFSLLWPWMGLGLAAILLLGLGIGDLRGDRAVARTRDMAWLAWAATAAYLLHQFEEHGIDASGAPYRSFGNRATGWQSALQLSTVDLFKSCFSSHSIMRR